MIVTPGPLLIQPSGDGRGFWLYEPGGQRIQFATAEDWIERLRVVREATP